jgi:hypothetical protein
MKEGLAALTKFVKVVMAYRPDRGKETKPQSRRRPPKLTNPSNKGRSPRT